MRIAVLSDTHSPRRWKTGPPAVARALDGADVILHAGDVCRAETLVELESFAPVYAVLGNNDTPDVAEWGAPERLELVLGGLPVAMIHDSGLPDGRPARLRQMFPSASLVIFGHSHIPLDHVEAGQRILNPGSPTDRRRQPHGTMAELLVDDGELHSARIFPVT